MPTGSAKSRHIDPMARPSNWRWRGDRFDPEMPIAVELHYELWSAKAEGIPVPDQEGFWKRRVSRKFDEHQLDVLCDEDLIGFAALHLLLHVLHGELPVQRAWEIGNFLHTRAMDEPFRRSWRRAHPPALRRIESIVFGLVTSWFGGNWPGALPPVAGLGLERVSLSLLEREWEPNKEELWLHLALVPDFHNKIRILFRRLLPLHGSRLDLPRVAHHVRTLLPTVLRAVRYKLSSPGIFAAENTRNGGGEDEYIQADRPLFQHKEI
jgi:hypothetical protein